MWSMPCALAVHLGMQHRATFLNTLVVSAADNPVVDDQHRTDRNTTGTLPLTRFFYGCFEEFVHVIASRLMKTVARRQVFNMRVNLGLTLVFGSWYFLAGYHREM